MLQGGGREVCDNDRGAFASGYNLSYHHIWPVEALQLYTPALGLVVYNQSHSLLHAASRHFERRETYRVIPQPVVAINLVSDIGLCQNN